MGWILIAGFMIYDGAGPFFAEKKTPPVEYVDLTYDDVSVNRNVYGQCYIVYDLIATGVTEDDSGNEKTDDYYWAVACDESSMMLVRTSAKDAISSDIEKMVDAWWDAETTDEYLKENPDGIYLDGVFKKNDSEIVGFYEDWCESLEFTETDGMKLAPCTLDCRDSLDDLKKEFVIGLGMLGVVLVGVVIFIVIVVSGSKKSSLQGASAVGVNYGNLSGGSPNGSFGTVMNGMQQNDSYGTGMGQQSAENVPSGMNGMQQSGENVPYGTGAAQPAAAGGLTLEKHDEAPAGELTLDKKDQI